MQVCAKTINQLQRVPTLASKQAAPWPSRRNIGWHFETQHKTRGGLRKHSGLLQPSFLCLLTADVSFYEPALPARGRACHPLPLWLPASGCTLTEEAALTSRLGVWTVKRTGGAQNPITLPQRDKTTARRDWNPSTELISTALLCIKWHIWKLQKERLYQEGISLVFIKMLPQSYLYAMYLIVSNTNKKTKHFRVKLTSTLFSPSCQSQNKQYKTGRKVSKCNSEILLTNRKTKN